MKPGIALLRPSRLRRGTVLPVALFLCMLAAISTILMFQTALDHRQINYRQREIANAYFAAEAGVQQVLNWGMDLPGYKYTPDDTLFVRNLTTGEFPNLDTALASGDYEIDSGELGSFTTSSDYEGTDESGETVEFSWDNGIYVSKVKSLTLIPYDAANDPIACMFKVRSIGESAHFGIEREVVAYLQPNPLAHTELKIPAALISLASIGQGGNGKVHWGEAWSKGDMTPLNKSHYSHLLVGNAAYDPWAKIRTEGFMNFPSNWGVGVNKDLFDPYNSGPTWDPTVARLGTPEEYYGLDRGYDPASSKKPDGSNASNGSYEGAFRVKVPVGDLKFPDLLSQYEAFKEQAKTHGRYYTTQAGSDKIFKDGVAKDFNTELSIPDGQSRAASPYDLVFIDTIDGNPPAADGSNLASVKGSGNPGVGLKGILWIGANLYVGGAGNPQSMVCEKPDGSTENLAKVYHDGVMYTAGTMAFQGNPVVYGCLVAEKGFASGGTPDVYYNHKLKTGLELPAGNIGSVFRIVMQRNRGL